MQVVIDIPEQMYLNAKADMLCGGDILVKAIKNGIPLKDHGRLIDAERLLSVIHKNTVGDLFDQLIDMQPTIIEADKGGNEN